MPYLLIGVLLVIAILVLAALGIMLARALRRFGMVRGWLEDFLTARFGLIRARRAALGIAIAEFRRDGLGRDHPRTVKGSLEREDHRA
ncbi:MAG TPA: hypothetical protein VG756_04780 [Pseudonocardiaceae bacterium]|nr:hypothetical protein [Pseudonocardiaceae bacterium]